MKTDTIAKIEQQIATMPPLSPVTAQLLGIINEPNHSLQDVVSVVETDSLLTLIVLKTVNSAAYALERPIETVADAVLYLGDSIIAGLAMKLEKSGLYGVNLSGYLADADENWAHSLKTAIAARFFAKRFSGGTVREGVAYTAGILHDIGKALLSSILPENISKVAVETDFVDKEIELLGISHAEAGWMLGKSWNLPDAMIQAIRWHHTPSKADDAYKTLLYIIHLADISAMMSGSGTGIDMMRHTIDSDYVKYLSIGERELELAYLEIQIEYNTAFKAIQSSFESLVNSGSEEKL